MFNDDGIEVGQVECDDIFVCDLVVDDFVVGIHVDVVIDLMNVSMLPMWLLVL